jgi:hypothetical protein
MTISSRRDGDNVRIQITYGPVTATVDEHTGHAKVFWGELGRQLHDPEGRARGGYERFRDHAGHESLPSWDGVDTETRGHWIAALTEG